MNDLLDTTPFITREEYLWTRLEYLKDVLKRPDYYVGAPDVENIKLELFNTMEDLKREMKPACNCAVETPWGGSWRSKSKQIDYKDFKIPDWIYADIYTSECDFSKIEEALGFRLFTWQKAYILMGKFRMYGETTAKVVKTLIDPPMLNTPIDFSKPPITKADDYFRKELVRIKSLLDEHGVLTREVKVK